MEALNALQWEQDAAAFVADHLPAPVCRVLDVGCGDGWLTRRLAGAGYEVTGIDPDAPAEPALEPVSLEDFADPGPFDAVVSILALRHIDDLGAAVDKIAALLEPEGSIILVEYAWDLFDDATARWCLERLPRLGRPRKACTRRWSCLSGWNGVSPSVTSPARPICIPISRM